MRWKVENGSVINLHRMLTNYVLTFAVYNRIHFLYFVSDLAYGVRRCTACVCVCVCANRFVSSSRMSTSIVAVAHSYCIAMIHFPWPKTTMLCDKY